MIIFVIKHFLTEITWNAKAAWKVRRDFQRVLQREGKGKAIKYKDRRLWCIEDYCKEVAASNKLHCFECLINKIIFYISHCHWGRYIGRKKCREKKKKQTHFLLACIYIYVEIWKWILFVFEMLGSGGIQGYYWPCIFKSCFLLKSHQICPHKYLVGYRMHFFFTLLCIILKGRKGSWGKQHP